jgi:hypothetical protein
MKELLVLLAHLLTTLARLLGPGGAKAIVADSLLMKQQLLIVNRSRQRAPNLTVIDRYCSASGRYFSVHITLSEQRSFSGHRHFLNFTTCSRSESIDCCIHLADKESQVPRVHHENSYRLSLN